AALGRFAAVPPQGLLTRPELPAAQALSARGLPARPARTLVRPLLTALLSDPDLTTSSRVADLTLRGFARGGLCVPAGGQATVPELLAAALPDGTVRTGVRATSVSTHAVATERHGTFPCEAVLVATGARSAAALLPGLRVPDFHPVTVLHHAAEEPVPLGAPEPSFTVCAGRDEDGAEDAAPVSHTWVASAVDPSRAEPGRTLVTSVVLGERSAEPPAALDKAARGQLARVYGTSTDRWELLAAYHDPDAVPAMPAPHDPCRPVRVLSGLYVCGEHRDTSTPRGALVSAERATEQILRDFGRPAVPGQLAQEAAA
ncbi:FAD-dependent oxidoreductase, partial [Streptomyces albus subsp. chlorinus]